MYILKILLALILFPFHAQAAGEEIFAELFGRPEMKLQTKASYGFQAWQPSAFENSSGKIKRHKHALDMSMPLSSDLMNKWKLLLTAGFEENITAARFQNLRPMPNRLFGLGAGFSHSRVLDNGDTFAQNLIVSSQGDKPFGALRDVSFQANLIYKKPGAGESAWIYFLNLANNRGFLPYVPIPGFAYYFKASENLRVLAGIPFFSFFYTPLEKTIFTLSYFPLRYVNARLAYYLFGPAHIYLSSRFHSENYLLSDRTDKKERLFYEEGISQLGFNMPLESNLLIDASVGYSYARKYFLAQKTSQRKTTANALNPKNAGALHLKLVAVF